MASQSRQSSTNLSADGVTERNKPEVRKRDDEVGDMRGSVSTEMECETASHKRLRLNGEAEAMSKDSDEESCNQTKRTKSGEDGDGTEDEACMRGEPRERRDDRAVEPQTKRHRLLFPDECKLSYQKKVLWTVQLGREHRSFQPLLKEGKYKPYITVGTLEAVQHLTVEGYNGVVLQLPPQEQEHANKVLIFRYPVWLEPEYLLDDPRIVWARRNKVRGEPSSQVIALIRGDIPDAIFVTGIGRRPVRRYIEEQTMCLRCSKWGHQSWSCQNDERCRFCGGRHISTRCGEKIRANMKVEPRCCNCGGPHNAKAMVCPKRPGRSVEGARQLLGPRPNPPSPPEWEESHLFPSLPLPSHGEGQVSRAVTGQQVVRTNDWERGRPNLQGPQGSLSQVHQHLAVDGDGHSQAAPGVGGATGPTGSPDAGESRNDAVMQHLSDFSKRVEALEKIVSDLASHTLGAATQADQRPKTQKGESGEKGKDKLECKIKVKGKQKVIKSHKLMTTGVSGLEAVIGKCGDESKKEVLYKEWLEMYRHMDRVMDLIEELPKPRQETPGNNG